MELRYKRKHKASQIENSKTLDPGEACFEFSRFLGIRYCFRISDFVLRGFSYSLALLLYSLPCAPPLCSLRSVRGKFFLDYRTDLVVIEHGWNIVSVTARAEEAVS
jgi:hypothetical protein